jgi:hypothetical protein
MVLLESANWPGHISQLGLGGCASRRPALHGAPPNRAKASVRETFAEEAFAVAELAGPCSKPLQDTRPQALSCDNGSATSHRA